MKEQLEMKYGMDSKKNQRHSRLLESSMSNQCSEELEDEQR